MSLNSYETSGEYQCTLGKLAMHENDHELLDVLLSLDSEKFAL